VAATEVVEEVTGTRVTLSSEEDMERFTEAAREAEFGEVRPFPHGIRTCCCH